MEACGEFPDLVEGELAMTGEEHGDGALRSKLRDQRTLENSLVLH